MLTKLMLSNFKCFRRAQLDLGLVSIIVGDNASGKSSVGEALAILQNVAKLKSVSELGDKLAGFKRTGSSVVDIIAEFPVFKGENLRYSTDQVLVSAGKNGKGLSLEFESEEILAAFSRTFSGAKILKIDPRIACIPSLSGCLGNRGENLSTVLSQLYFDAAQNCILLEWLQELTSIVDLDFPVNSSGETTVNLVNAIGQRIPLANASDGTIKLLVMLAALLSAKREDLLFIDDIESSLHPSVLSPLFQLIQQKADRDSIQVVATTHSPPLLRLITPQIMGSVFVAYRLPGDPDAHIKRILEISGITQALEHNDLGKLHEVGVLESALRLEDYPRRSPSPLPSDSSLSLG